VAKLEAAGKEGKERDGAKKVRPAVKEANKQGPQARRRLLKRPKARGPRVAKPAYPERARPCPPAAPGGCAATKAADFAAKHEGRRSGVKRRPLEQTFVLTADAARQEVAESSRPLQRRQSAMVAWGAAAVKECKQQGPQARRAC